MKGTFRILIPTIATLSVCILVRADVLELKNGTVLSGKFVGGSPGIVRFETSGGVQVIETSQAVALTFTTPVQAHLPGSQRRLQLLRPSQPRRQLQLL
jgi:hypothetical protein